MNEEMSPLRPSKNDQPLSELYAKSQIADGQALDPSLEQWLQQMVPLDEWTAISQVPINRLDYQTFLNTQDTSHLHPVAKAQTSLSHPLDLPVEDLSTVEQLKFCAWLSNKASQPSHEILFDYHPPDSKDLEKVGLHGSKQFYVLRHTIDRKYFNLIDDLASGHWRDADQETYRLMINTISKEEGQPFTLHDLKTFPCKDLLILDRLWVKYSEGKWGFSVQKRMWNMCGSPTEFNNDWTRFCNSVGWNIQGIGMDDGKPILAPRNSLQGKLPFYGYLWKKMGLRRLGLFVRQDF